MDILIKNWKWKLFYIYLSNKCYHFTRFFNNDNKYIKILTNITPLENFTLF